MDMINGSDTAEAKVADTSTETTAPGTAKPRRAKAKKAPPPKRQVVQSTIAFPYRDLESAISVAKSILDAGGVALTSDQLAGIMGLQAGSGNFMIRAAAARVFGLITYAGGKYDLTNLGFAILDERSQRTARAEAFLTVPLYRRTYDEFKGKPLPPRPHGLEAAFMKFGVAPKQKDTARLVFDKSAQQAGFFAAGMERLIEPIIGGAPPINRPPVDDGNGGGGGGGRPSANEGGGDVGRFHPFIQGLLDRLPEPDTTWTVEGRAKWLQAASNCFDLLYQGDGQITITVTPADK